MVSEGVCQYTPDRCDARTKDQQMLVKTRQPPLMQSVHQVLHVFPSQYKRDAPDLQSLCQNSVCLPLYSLPGKCCSYDCHSDGGNNRPPYDIFAQNYLTPIIASIEQSSDAPLMSLDDRLAPSYFIPFSTRTYCLYQTFGGEAVDECPGVRATHGDPVA